MRPAAASAASGQLAEVARRLGARIVEAFALVLVLASLVFFALRVLPGDPAALVLGDEATPNELARVRGLLHLDEPLGAQYLRFVHGLVTLDLGDSLRRPGTRATACVGEALAPTAELAGLAVLVGALLGVGAALLASGPWLRECGKTAIDRALVGAAAVPLVAFAPVVTWALAVRVRVVPLPADPDAGLAGLSFGATLLALPLAAHVGRVARAALREVAGAPFLTVAKAKGGRPLRIWILHAVPVVAGPIVTVVATQLGALLGGAVVIERLFERWGLGTLLLEAYSARDLPVLEGAVVAAGMLFVVAQTIATALHLAIDPRARASR